MGILDWLFGKKSRDSEVRDVAIEKEEVKIKSSQMESKEEAKTQEIGKAREVDLSTLGDVIRACDVKRLSEAFQQAANWDAREWVVVALGNICRDSKADVDYDKSEMIKTLEDIIQVCKAETTGGTYRTACLENAQMLLGKLLGQPLPTPEERDARAGRPASVSEGQVKAKADRAGISERLMEISPVQVADWLTSQGSRFGPMTPKDPNSAKVWHYDIDQAVEFISKVLEGEVIHYTGGKEEIVFGPDHVMLEIYGAGARLQRRYVIVKDCESDQYLRFLTWLA